MPISCLMNIINELWVIIYSIMLRPKIKRVWKDEINQDACLAKTERIAGIVQPGMTVVQHCTATGRISEVLSQQFPFLARLGLFLEGYQLIASLHDVGKISPTFQTKIANALPLESGDSLLSLFGLNEYKESKPSDIPHSVISYSALKDLLGKQVAYIEGAHHGWLQDDRFAANAERFGGDEWQKARIRFVDEMKSIFGCAIQDLSGFDASIIQFLLGLTTVSDWISSSIALNELGSKTIFLDSVVKSGFHAHEYKAGLSFKDIFGFDMRPEQEAFVDSVNGPGVYILEAGTGSGKTEAALYAAYKLLSAEEAEGIYFALPTTLSSRHIKKRVDAFLKAILAEEYIPSKLVFGNSFLYNCVFADGFPESSWFDSRKRMILAPFGVGTIDQALMSVISVKHSAVRTFGLAGKVVILDEVHSYDSYTGLLIDELIKQLRSLGATVIILSATLQKSVRMELIGAHESENLSDAYPSVTVSSGASIREIAVKGDKRKTISLVHENDRESAIDSAVEDTLDGQYVLWIENTVADAQDAYRKFSSRCWGVAGTGLIHSRFLGNDRSRKENEYTAIFSKENWDKRGSGKGFILVGTQILEQSLDIDADVLYTAIAPIDMVFQRIGRLWRHDHPGRRGKPICHLLHPSAEDVQDNPDVLGPSAAVYSGYILYRTIKALENTETISVPYEIRLKLDEVYSDINEYNTKIISLKNELISKTSKLRNLAYRSISKVGSVLSDTALPRYSELRYKRVLLISKIKPEEGKILLIEGEWIDLLRAQDPREKAMISIQLEESIINVPESSCPSLVKSEKADDMLSRYIYVDDDFYIMLKGDGHQLFDVFGNLLEKCHYEPNLGYYLSKE